MTNKASDPFRKSHTGFKSGFIVSFRKTIVWTLVILILSFLPGKAIEKVKLFDISFQDLIVHFLMYFVFSVLLIKELSAKENNRFSKMSGWIIPLLATAVLGVVTEIIQHLWISGRYGSMSDFILDIAGSASAILFCRISWFRNMFKL